jgi:hypothetical protein
MSASAPDRLHDAERAALRQSQDRTVSEPVVACPLQQTPRRCVLDVEVVGEDDSPVAGVAVELRKSDTEVLLHCTGPAGTARFESLEAGSYRLCLYELDAGCWDLISTAPLPPAEAESSGDAPWVAPPARAAETGFEHAIAQGECIAKLAERFGFSPDTVWSHAPNADVAALRKDRNILNPGDSIAIPPKQLKSVDGTTGHTHRLRRKGVPETLRIRFLRDGKPRAGIPYLLALTTATGEPIADRSGTTDGDGFVTQPVPPATTHAHLTLGNGAEQEIHRFDVSHLDPIDTISGVRGRLHSLGYECDGVGNALDWMTRSAVACFQIDHGLEPTGEPAEGAFLAELQKAYLS